MKDRMKVGVDLETDKEGHVKLKDLGLRKTYFTAFDKEGFAIKAKMEHPVADPVKKAREAKEKLERKEKRAADKKKRDAKNLAVEEAQAERLREKLEAKEKAIKEAKTKKA